MLKALSFFLTLLLCFDADAVFKQSASQALSYKNIVTSGASQRATRRSNSHSDRKKHDALNPISDKIKIETVNLKKTDKESVSLNKGDELKVILDNDDNYDWKPSTTTSNVHLLSEDIKGDELILKYKINLSSSFFIYFDCIDKKTNKVLKTKQLRILPRN